MTTNSSDRDGNRNGNGGIMRSPAVGKLKEAAGAYAAAQGVKLASRAGSRMTGLTGKLEDVSENGGSLGSLGQVAKGVVGGGDSNGEGGLMKRAASKVTDKVKSAVGGGKGKSGQAKSMNIVEDIDVGVPISVAYDQWTQVTDFPRFMKGVQSVDQKDETTTSWRGKVFKSTRTWEGKVIEQIPDQRIVWTSEGPKGTNKGVVTFHELGPELTRVLLDIEYFPSGVIEKTANLWRPAGRRARLDLKHYRRFIMMEGEATGSWRGRIEDGEVVSEGEEAEESDSQDQDVEMSEQDSDRAEDSEQDEPEDSEDSEDEAPAPQRTRRRARSEEPEEEPDEEPEEEVDEEPEEEVDEEPAPRRTRSRRSEPDADSDGDAAPRRARRTRTSTASRSR